MAASVLVDAGFLVALLNERDTNHAWAESQAPRSPPVWLTCEAVLSEGFHLLGPPGTSALAEMLKTRMIVCAFKLDENVDNVLSLITRYDNVPMSLADACLVRMSEILLDPIVLTTDADFRIYRRHGRQVVPCVMP
jgi:predicted nucleic acid-binding protein